MSTCIKDNFHSSHISCMLLKSIAKKLFPFSVFGSSQHPKKLNKHIVMFNLRGQNTRILFLSSSYLKWPWHFVSPWPNLNMPFKRLLNTKPYQLSGKLHCFLLGHCQPDKSHLQISGRFMFFCNLRDERTKV